MATHRYELSSEQWHKIKLLLPGKKGDVGRTAHNNRRFINAVLYIARSGAPWRDLPERYDNWNSVYQRVNRWSKQGRWQVVFDTLRENDPPDLDWVMIDSSIIRVHQHAAGQKSTLRQAVT